MKEDARVLTRDSISARGARRSFVLFTGKDVPCCALARSRISQNPRTSPSFGSIALATCRFRFVENEWLRGKGSNLHCQIQRLAASL